MFQLSLCRERFCSCFQPRNSSSQAQETMQRFRSLPLRVEIPSLRCATFRAGSRHNSDTDHLTWVSFVSTSLFQSQALICTEGNCDPEREEAGQGSSASVVTFSPVLAGWDSSLSTMGPKFPQCVMRPKACVNTIILHQKWPVFSSWGLAVWQELVYKLILSKAWCLITDN